MNLLQLVLKQMRQRSLSTWLTLLSVLLGVGLATGVMLLRREGANLFGQKNYGFDIVVGAKGSKLQLVLNSVYHLDQSPGNIPYSLYQQMTEGSPAASLYRRYVKWAVPMAVGDNYRGHRVVGTLPRIFGIGADGERLADDLTFEYRIGEKFRFSQGGPFQADKYQAVVGSQVAARTGLKIGDSFQVEHGLVTSSFNPDIHEQKWRVVGILEPTHTANDRVIFIPLLSFYAMSGHGEALTAISEFEREHGFAPEAPAGTLPDHPEATTTAAHDPEHVELAIPPEQWKLSGILVRTRSPMMTDSLLWAINNAPVAMAANPAMEMRAFFQQFLEPNLAVFLAITVLVTVVAGVSILVSIYNSVSARIREIAILRALGATRKRILAMICIEAGLIGLVGGLLGMLAGHLIIGSIASAYLRTAVGQPINWLVPSGAEGLYLLGVVLLATLAGLVPALKAYRTPVATNLVAA